MTLTVMKCLSCLLSVCLPISLKARGVQEESDGLRKEVRLRGGPTTERARCSQLVQRIQHERFQ
jgi:hypothetical protein